MTATKKVDSPSYYKTSHSNGHVQPSHAISKPAAQTYRQQEQNGYFKRSSFPLKTGNTTKSRHHGYSSNPSEEDEDDSSTSSQQQSQSQSQSQSKPRQDLIDCINEHLFGKSSSDNTGVCNFPVGLKIKFKNTRAKAEVERLVAQFSKLSITEGESDSMYPHKHFVINFKSKPQVEDLMYKLYDKKIEFELDYSKFVSHPGVLFIKNLSCDLVSGDNDSLSDVSVDTNSDDGSKRFQKLHQFLSDNCHFKSLQDIRLFHNDSQSHSSNDSRNGSPHSTSSPTAFAIVKFANYLDVDILVDKLSKHTPNIFNDNPNVPLFVNRYINKRERLSFASASGVPHNFISRRSSSTSITDASMSTSSSTSGSTTSSSSRHHHSGSASSRNSNDNFSLIVLENLINFFPPEFTKDKCDQFLNKLKMFGNPIESIYIPIIDNGEDLNTLHPLDFGYIRFKTNANSMENTFRMLYYMNDLSWDEVMALDMKNLAPLMEDDSHDGTSSVGKSSKGNDNDVDKNDARGKDSTVTAINRNLFVTIAQHKHNNYLFSQASQCYLSFNPSLLNKNQSPLVINYPNPVYTINSFIRNVNYQETNLYVNNFSAVFNNDDATWESFWKQFGLIKSAKIIKPHFYQDGNAIEGEEQKAGRIGFVFYETFKMAIRAILMTNNKLVHVDGFNPMVIQSSFAIQKSNSNYKAYHLPPAPPMGTPTMPLPLDVPFNGNKSLGCAAAAAAAHAGPGGGMQYYTYQPIMPYCYAYHPNPYLYGAQGMLNAAGVTPNFEPSILSADGRVHVGAGQSNGNKSTTSHGDD
ncbi:hypothetical protein KGF57_000792 [Candida theae]|uniref:RRM domain-containing protein n=1 Tax=Candida theae TaxID=1198502 RepID=A0AAD5G0H6_9ASCO|nr:uncharacterized protein KGF57_000792 [Candida theae]KAI5965427.1 hypothetical protein KGF57_000792 [Candida theae]